MILAFTVVVALFGTDPSHAAIDVFVGGEGGYPAYRIPSLLVTRAGTVLAFAEGRATLADHAMNDLVLRRSEDGGETFSEVTTLQDAGNDALNNPCAVEVRDESGGSRVLLLYQRYPAGKGEYQVKPGIEGDAICRTFAIESSDQGKTFSPPRDLTAMVKDESATSLACGPGVGLQKQRAPHRGRVVIPFNQGPGPRWRVFAAYSDDFGSTWTRGALAEDSETQGAANEVQMLELGDGSLLLNARSMNGAKRRKVARSYDGGETWTRLADDPALIEPEVMASLLRIEIGAPDSPTALVLYCGPGSESERVDGRIAISTDEGSTWSGSRPVAEGFFAYSSMAVLGEGVVGVLYEADRYRAIRLARITVTAPRDG